MYKQPVVIFIHTLQNFQLKTRLKLYKYFNYSIKNYKWLLMFVLSRFKTVNSIVVFFVNALCLINTMETILFLRNLM